MRHKPATKHNDASLITKTLNGDNSSFDMLIAMHEKSLFMSASMLLGNDEDAADVVQDTFAAEFLNHYKSLVQHESSSDSDTYFEIVSVMKNLDEKP